jgi:hypothetical protein
MVLGNFCRGRDHLREEVRVKAVNLLDLLLKKVQLIKIAKGGTDNGI